MTEPYVITKEKSSKWAWEQDVSPLGRLVLLALSDLADDYGLVWDTPYRVLSEKTGISIRKMCDVIPELRERGLIQNSNGTPRILVQ